MCFLLMKAQPCGVHAQSTRALSLHAQQGMHASSGRPQRQFYRWPAAVWVLWQLLSSRHMSAVRFQ